MNKTICGDLVISAAMPSQQILAFAQCKVVFGNVVILNMFGRNLPPMNIEKICGNLRIENCQFLWQFEKLKEVEGDLVVKNSKISGFECLESVSKNLKLKNSSIVHLHELAMVGQNIVMDNSQIVHAPKLVTVQNVLQKNSSIIHLPSEFTCQNQICIKENEKN